MLGQLLSYIKSLKEEFNSCTASSRRGRHAADAAAPPTGKNLPGVVNNIVWARQLQAKVSTRACVRCPYICVCMCACVRRMYVCVYVCVCVCVCICIHMYMCVRLVNY